MAKLVSKTYGDALFELALEENKIDSLQEEVAVVLEALAENQDLGKLMNHPNVSKEDKVEVIENIFTGRVSAELTGLMHMLTEKGRYAEIDDVLEYFLNRVKEHKNIGIAYVSTALELSDAQKKAVEKRLLETTKYVEFELPCRRLNRHLHYSAFRIPHILWFLIIVFLLLFSAHQKALMLCLHKQFRYFYVLSRD